MAALKLVMMGVVFVALLGASPSTVEARTHIPSILTTYESLENTGLMAGPPCDCGGKDCCDTEICIQTLPCKLICSCADVGECCHAACQNCNCTETLPPQCRCMDITPYMHGKCTV